MSDIESGSTVQIRMEGVITSDPATAEYIKDQVLERLQGLGGIAFTITVTGGNTDQGLPSQEPLQEWLNMDVVTAWRNAYPNEPTRALALKRGGIYCLRDAFVMGRAGLLDVTGIGQQSMDKIISLMENNPFGIPILEDPTPEQVAEICTGIAQVPLVKVSHWLRYIRDTSLKDIMGMSEDQIGELISNRYSSDEEVKVRAAAIIRAVQAFTDRFEAARKSQNLLT